VYEIAEKDLAKLLSCEVYPLLNGSRFTYDRGQRTIKYDDLVDGSKPNLVVSRRLRWW